METVIKSGYVEPGSRSQSERRKRMTLDQTFSRTRGKKVSPVTHEEVEDATARFLAQGGVIEQLPDLWNAIREVDVRFQL